MRFIVDGPDIPTSLLRAQREGSLIFVVGAGVSRAAGLPLFAELADQVYTRSGKRFQERPEVLPAEQKKRPARRVSTIV